MRVVAVIGVAVVLATTSCAGPRKRAAAFGFDVFAVDTAGGGWVVHRQMGRGDTLWGCRDLAMPDSCVQVMLDDWKTGAALEVLHVSTATQRAWVRVGALGDTDVLLACGSPEDGPRCDVVGLELMPPSATLRRVWPGYVDAGDQRRLVIEEGAGDMWIEAGPPRLGPVNMYACTGLRDAPQCVLSVPNWLAVDREPLGFRKLEDIETEGPDGQRAYGPGVRVSRLDEESVAYERGFREGDVIVAVGDTPTNRASAARSLLLQAPALAPVRVTKASGEVVTLSARRRPRNR